jgi:hypothetical protein
MIVIPTTFIVGAGASTDYGFPLGSNLAKRISSELMDATSLLRSWLQEAEFEAEALENFAKRLKNSGLKSIDAFLENNNSPELLAIGKSCIAALILEGEEKCLKNDLLFAGAPDDHWIRHVWNCLHSGSSKQTLHDSRLSFVTFNYDRVIEHFLQTVIENAFGMSREEAVTIREQAIPIVHLHGSLGQLPFGSTKNLPDGLRTAAAGIRVVHDAVADDDPEFSKARHLLDEAMNVCLVGFGYDRTNAERLRLRKQRDQKFQMHGSAFGLHEGERQSAAELTGANITNYTGYRSEQFLRHHVQLK